MIEITLTKEQHAAALLAYAETLGIKIAQTPNVAYEWRADEHGNIHCTFKPTTGFHSPDLSKEMKDLQYQALDEVWEIFDKWVVDARSYDGAKKSVTSRGTKYVTLINGNVKEEGEDAQQYMTSPSHVPDRVRAADVWPSVREGIRQWIYKNAKAKHNVLVWRIRPTWIIDSEGYGAWRCRLAVEDGMLPEIPTIEPGKTKDWRDADGGFGQGVWGL